MGAARVRVAQHWYVSWRFDPKQFLPFALWIKTVFAALAIENRLGYLSILSVSCPYWMAWPISILEGMSIFLLRYYLCIYFDLVFPLQNRFTINRCLPLSSKNVGYYFGIWFMIVVACLSFISFVLFFYVNWSNRLAPLDLFIVWRNSKRSFSEICLFRPKINFFPLVQ